MGDTVFAVVVLGCVFVLLDRTRVVVEALSDVMKRVSVDGRIYVVTRLGGGAYNVTDSKSLAHLSFNQQGVLERVGDTRQLAADMNRFPDELFRA